MTMAADWCSLLTFDISELPVFLFLNISKTVADIFLIFYIWIHIDDMHSVRLESCQSKELHFFTPFSATFQKIFVVTKI